MSGVKEKFQNLCNYMELEIMPIAFTSRFFFVNFNFINQELSVYILLFSHFLSFV